MTEKPIGSPTPALRRSLGLPYLTAYGLGTMVGAGFYALLGKVAGEAGMATPLAFLVAALVAFLSALSFGHLSARFPVSSGEARYVREAFGRRWLSVVVGWCVIATGVVSAATLSNAFAGFLQDLVPVDRGATVVLLVLALGALAAWGIGESVTLVVVITLIEVGGLLWVLFVTGEHLAELPDRAADLLPDWTALGLSGVLSGAFLAFYAFVGFEDMVNVAEEVKDPARNLPRGIFLAFCATALLYFLVASAAVLAVPAEELARSQTPMATLVGARGTGASLALSSISLLAGVNGALVQILMAARVAFGLARAGDAPRFLSRIHAGRKTPVWATAFVALLVLVLAVGLPLEPLARMTSSVLLFVFALVNLSLWRLLGRDQEPRGRLVPMVGFLLCVALLGFQVLRVVSERL